MSSDDRARGDGTRAHRLSSKIEFPRSPRRTRALAPTSARAREARLEPRSSCARAREDVETSKAARKGVAVATDRDLGNDRTCSTETARPAFAFLTTFYPPYNFGGDGIGIQRLAAGSRVRPQRHDHPTDGTRLAAQKGEATTAAAFEVSGLRSARASCPFLTSSSAPDLKGPRNRRILRTATSTYQLPNVARRRQPGSRDGGRQVLMAHEHGWCAHHVLWRQGRRRAAFRKCIRASSIQAPAERGVAHDGL